MTGEKAYLKRQRHGERREREEREGRKKKRGREVRRDGGREGERMREMLRRNESRFAAVALLPKMFREEAPFQFEASSRLRNARL